MLFLYALSLAVYASHLSTAEQEVLVNVHELFSPELFLVKYIRRKDFGGHASRKVFDALTMQCQLFCSVSSWGWLHLPDEASINGRVISVCFGIRFLKQRQPCLVRIAALCEVQGPRASLEDGTVLLIW